MNTTARHKSAEPVRLGRLSQTRLKTASEPRTTRVRGQAFRGLLGAAGAVLGAEVIDPTLALLPREARDSIARAGISGSTHYPMSWYTALHRALREISGGGRELGRVLGREARRHDARGIYRFVLRFVSPESLLANMQRVMALYADGPIISSGVVTTGDGSRSAPFRVDEAHGFDENVWQEVCGSIEALVELAQGRACDVVALEGGVQESWLGGEVRWASQHYPR